MPNAIEATINALKSVRGSRYFATERGFHGAFYCALRSELEQLGLLSEERILEMEYQKSERHGIHQRPDIVFHIPVEISRSSVRDYNFAVWALKHRAFVSEAESDFTKLNEMMCVLRYSLAIFVNVGSSETRLDSYSGDFREQIHAFAVPSASAQKIHHSYFEAANVVHTAYDILE